MEDPQSIGSSSGTPYCMAAALKRQGCEISFSLQLTEQNAALVSLKNRMTRVIIGKHIICERDPKVGSPLPGADQRGGPSASGRRSTWNVLILYGHQELPCPLNILG